MKFFNYLLVFVSFLLFFASLLISIATDDIVRLSLWTKAIIIAAMLILYILVEASKNYQISKKTKENIIKAILSKVDELNYLTGAPQRIRANIFRQQKAGWHSKVKAGYKICYQYNMDSHGDRDLYIPVNMGVTGEVFRTRVPLFSTSQNFRHTSSYRLPGEILAKVPSDVEWIYSIPVKYKNGNVMMTLTIDGTQSTSNIREDEQAIERVANKIVRDLQQIVFTP